MEKKDKIEEIGELITIPEVKEFFLSALIEAKEKFKDQIQRYRETKNRLKEEEKQEVAPPGLNELSTDKSYFFDMIRTDAPESDGHRWVVEKFKFKDKPGIVSFIFSDFIKKIDQVEIDPQQIKTHDVSSLTGISFKITFTKSSDTHVGGFIKISSNQLKEQPSSDSTVIKISGRHNKEMDKEAMYQKIIQLMNDNPQVIEDIFFYLQIAQKSKK